MKKTFTSGLALLLPIVVTVMIVGFLINFLTQPFLETTKTAIEQSSLFRDPIFIIHRLSLITLFSKAAILAALFGLTLLVGFLGRHFFLDSIFRYADIVIHKLPIINKIYKICQDVILSLFSSSSKKFTQVVFVPFPNSHSLSIGLITGDEIKLQSHGQRDEDLISVFIPGTPNPSVGFLLMFKRKQILFANMKVDQAMKLIVSCGIAMPDIELLEPHEEYETPIFDQSHILSGKRQPIKNSAHLFKS